MSILTKDSNEIEYFSYILSPGQTKSIYLTEKKLFEYVKNVFKRKKIEKFIVDKKNLIRQMYLRTEEKLPESEKAKIIHQVIIKETSLKISLEELKDYLIQEKIGLGNNQIY